MKIYKKGILFSIVLGTLMSCNISRTIIGNYSRNCNFTSSRFLIDRDNSFCYNYQTEGTGRKEWSCGQWEEISKNRIQLTSILHDSVPIYVSEYKQNIGNKLIILSNEWSGWDLPIELIVNGKCVINTTGHERAILLSDADFPIIESIFVRASLTDPILSELANFTTISTMTYNVVDTDSNIFYISLPYRRKLYEFFYMKEFQDTLLMNRKSMMYDNIKFQKNDL